jgi:chemotaxis protein MotA
MFFVGLGIVFGSVFAGYLIAGGHLDVLWQPSEFIIILGAAAGAFVIANRGSVMHEVGVGFKKVTSDKIITKKEYLELLCAMFSIFRIARTKGLLAIEPHIDKPYESGIFALYPTFLNNERAVTMFCDYIRLITMGLEDSMKMDDLMRDEVDLLRHEAHAAGGAVNGVADGMPALGIVAAVLGVIHTMGSIDQPPAVLGKLIGAALVGTFFGVLMSYGLIAPIAQRMNSLFEIDLRYFDCIRIAIVSHVENFPPQISIENARKYIDPEIRPSFQELEEALAEAGEGSGG